MSKTAMNGRRVLTPISKAAVKEFCKENKIKMSEFAEVTGYASQASLSHALNNGYIQAEALSNLYQFFDLPKGYFDSTHSTRGDGVVLAEREKETPLDEPLGDVFDDMANITAEFFDKALKAEPEDEEKLNVLMKAYGFTSHADVIHSAIESMYQRYCDSIAEKYKDLSKDELIAKLVERDLKKGGE